MEGTSLSSQLQDVDLPFVSTASGGLSLNDPVRFARIKGQRKACQSIAIAGILGVDPIKILRDLIRSARRLRRGIRTDVEDVTKSKDKVNAALVNAGFDMSEEEPEDYTDYDYASETVIVGYLITKGFKDVTDTALPGTTAKNMYISTFCAQVPEGRYVLMTAGHAVGVCVAGAGKGRTLSYFDGDAGDGHLAEGSRHKAIMSVFSP